MPKSPADSHDLDKLSRWRQGLADSTTGVFPTYAVFLVTPEDLHAHDVFREFRSSFGKLGAQFEHLVIFGQHGISSTVLGLLDQLGHSLESLPMLALFSGPPTSTFHSLSLRKGPNSDSSRQDPTELGTGCDALWRALLDRLEGAAAGKAVSLDFESLSGVTKYPLGNGSMEKLLGEVWERVSAA